MEDEHAIYHIPEKEFFSAEIYDGHGGGRAAKISAEMLTPLFLDLWYSEVEKPLKKRRKEYELLRSAYLGVDKHIADMGTSSGTTAATFYILKERFIAANVGDTRAVIGTKKGCYTLT